MLWLEIPAYAGSTRTSATPTGTAPDHPRIRGEHACPISDEELDEGSSPHTRGARKNRLKGEAQCRIIPAYAGSTIFFWRVRHGLSDHPRIRGEHTPPWMWRVLRRGSSPHTRGAPCCRAWPSHPPTDHPRIRGEHLQQSMGAVDDVGSSPHTRGAHQHHTIYPLSGGIIPAYAGSTISGQATL